MAKWLIPAHDKGLIAYSTMEAGCDRDFLGIEGYIGESTCGSAWIENADIVVLVFKDLPE